MNKKSVSHQQFSQVILAVTSQIEQERLLTPVLGQTLLVRQIAALAKTGITDLIFYLPLQADKLRRAIRRAAINFPLRLQTLNLDPKFSLYQNLLTALPQLQDKFFLTSVLNLDAAYQASQLQTWSADLVVTTQTVKPATPLGSVQVQQKLVTAASHQLIKNYHYLSGGYLLTKTWLTTLAAATLDEHAWFQAIDHLAQTGLVKACDFAKPSDLPEIASKSYLLALSRRFFAESDKYIADSAQIAPSARLKGPLIIEEGSVVGEFCCLEGPIYLGQNVQVGNFCNLRPDLYIESGAVIDSYTESGDHHIIP